MARRGDDGTGNGAMQELARLVDGDEDALARHADALSDDDALRDARHEAARVAEWLPRAAEDYAPPSPETLESRVCEVLDARVGQAADAAEGAGGDAGAATADAEGEGGPLSGPRTRAWVVGGLAAVGLVAATVGIASQYGGGRSGEAGGGSEAALRGRLDRIVRAADDDASGVSVRAAGADASEPATAGDELGAGATVRTDARTRVRLELSDGSWLTLDHDTELTLDATAPRTLRLSRGEVLAEVARLQGAPQAVFETPAGRVEVLGTKFSLSATADRASVRVTRGEVKVHSDREARLVAAGQEAILREGGAPEVGPAVNLASTVRFSELGVEPEDDVPVPGIGELRARRPGEDEEQERPLTLARHEVRTRIAGNVARTEIEETFRNDGSHELEGIYSFPLPPGARIAHLALEVDGEWERGAFVARERAEKIWRGVLRNATPERERQPQQELVWVPGPWRDPALLEWQQGGRFRLRIFPIPAEGERRVRIAYEQTLPPHGHGRRYVYPLAHSGDGSTRVGRFEMDVRIAGEADVRVGGGYDARVERDGTAQRIRFSQDRFLPAGDFVLDYARANADRELTWWTYGGEATSPPPGDRSKVDREVHKAHREVHVDGRPYAVFALRPQLPAWTRKTPRDYVLAVDVSQSMVGERARRASRLVSRVIAEMDRRDRFALLACDASCQRPSGQALRTPSAKAAEDAGQWLEGIRPAGASDLGAALREAAEVAADGGRDRETYVLYVGDGVSSVGHRRPGALAAEAKALASRHGLRIGTVGIGGDADDTTLAAIARGGGGHHVPFVPGQRTGAAALAMLEATYGVSLERPEVELPEGLVELAPAALPTLRAGEEVLLAARMERGEVEGELKLRGEVAGESWSQRYPVSLRAAESEGNAFVPRLWAANTIERLQLEGRGDEVPRIVALSKAYGVMSRHVSLLVLESEAMHRAFGVDRQQQTPQWTGNGAPVGGGASGLERYRDSVEQQATGPLGTIGGGASAGAGPGAMGGNVSSSSGARDEERSKRARRAPARRPRFSVADADGAANLGGVPSARPRRRLMKRVWYRAGRIAPDKTEPTEAERKAVEKAEAALREKPRSRDRHRDLVRALSRAGRIAQAVEVAEQWLEHDPLDWEALTYLSDALGRKGERAQALRLLSGIADLEPDSDKLQRRMQNAFERAGMKERACAHAIARAEIDRDDAERLAEAVRCTRALGRDESAEGLLAMAPDERTRKRAATQAEEPNNAPSPRGQLLLRGKWDGEADVDLSLVTPEGTRLSWMGGRVNVVGEHGARPGREVVGVQWAAVGDYIIEVSRTRPDDTRPVRGEIEVEALDDKRTIPFTLEDERAVVGRVKVLRRSRLEPVR